MFEGFFLAIWSQLLPLTFSCLAICSLAPAIGQADDRAELAWNDPSAALMCLVNPTNPTGDYLDCATMRTYIEANAADGSTVIVGVRLRPRRGPSLRVVASMTLERLERTDSVPSFFTAHAPARLAY